MKGKKVFAVLYVIGLLVSLAGTGFLIGFFRQIKQVRLLLLLCVRLCCAADCEALGADVQSRESRRRGSLAGLYRSAVLLTDSPGQC